MKKIIFALIAVLVVVFAALSVLGAGGDYAAEQLLYRAMKTNVKISLNPDVAPPALLNSVERDLEKLLTRYPESGVAKAADMALTEFYIVHKNYDKAISTANNVIGKYPDDDGISSRAQFLKGVTYERQGNWPKALEEFRILQDKYPLTQLGVQVPLYIANYYDQAGQEAKAKEAYAQAFSKYEEMEREYSGKGFGYLASTLMIQVALSAENYEEAGRVLEQTLEKYPSIMAFSQLLPQVEPIFVEKLGKPEKAVSIYRNVAMKAGDTKLTEILDAKIKDIEEKK